MSGKRLYRSRDNRMIAGVCGGIGEYFNIDPTLIRLLLLFLTIWGGGGVVVYFIAWLIIPEAPVTSAPPSGAGQKPAGQPEQVEAKAEPAPAGDDTSEAGTAPESEPELDEEKTGPPPAAVAEDAPADDGTAEAEKAPEPEQETPEATA